MGYNFEIIYKPGVANSTINALSRLPMVSLAAITLSTPTHNLIPAIEASWKGDQQLKGIIADIESGKQGGLFTS